MSWVSVERMEREGERERDRVFNLCIPGSWERGKRQGSSLSKEANDLRSHGDFIPRWKSQTSGRQTAIYGKAKMKKREKETGFAEGVHVSTDLRISLKSNPAQNPEQMLG